MVIERMVYVCPENARCAHRGCKRAGLWRITGVKGRLCDEHFIAMVEARKAQRGETR